MERKVDIQELSNFLMDYTTSMMGVGVHTARAVRSVSRIAESFGYGIDVTIFQKNITMTIKHPEDYSIRRTYVRKIPALAINFQVISELSALSWEAYDHHLSLGELTAHYHEVMNEPRISRWVVLVLVSLANAAILSLVRGRRDCHDAGLCRDLRGFLGTAGDDESPRESYGRFRCIGFYCLVYRLGRDLFRLG